METKRLTVVSCSGASNTGKYSDVVARQLMQSGQAKMLCLARFSIDKQFAEKSKTEINKLVVLDGCPINCAELIMKQAGIVNFIHPNTIIAISIVSGFLMMIRFEAIFPLVRIAYTLFDLSIVFISVLSIIFFIGDQFETYSYKLNHGKEKI